MEFLKGRSKACATIATLLVFALVASVASLGCAGTLHDRVRTSALMAGETVLTLDQMERDLYATGAYGAEPAAKAQHLAIGAKVDAAILAVRAYERGARAWPAESPAMPGNLPELQRQALEALAQLAHVLDGVRGSAGMAAEIQKLIKQIGG